MVTTTLLDIFISSPSDVTDERKVALEVIEQFNGRKTMQEQYVLKPLAYENIVPGIVGESPQRVVDRYMLEAGNADIFICVLWSRMGTPVVDEASGERFESGTAYEFWTAYRANQRSRSLEAPGKPAILLYRCLRPLSPTADWAQLSKVQQFFQQFEGADAALKGMYKTYESPSDFARLLSQDLDTLLAEHLCKPHRRDAEVPIKPQPVRRDFYRHVPLPPNYVSREELLVEVRANLLTESPHVALTSAVLGKPTALHGMGGIGKTVMARALCDDAAVQAAFPDGILWASLGKDATVSDVLERMREWVTALGETVASSAPSLNTLKASLGRLLEARACLLIVDDVWQHTLADHFRVGGLYCRLLITTRDTEVAHELGAWVQPIPLMTEDEALALLVAWADGALTVVEDAMQRQIVRRLGRLPLAVKLAGAQLRRQRPEDWLRRFDAHNLRASRPEDIHDSLEQTFKLSLEDVNASVQRLYAALVIFREDEAILEVGIARLWEGLKGLERDQTSEVLDDLASRALLQVSADSPRTIVLHDLLRDLMGAELTENMSIIHDTLLHTYAKTKSGRGWHTAPDDGYLYTHLAYHLARAGRQDELYELLTASPTWMEAKFIACTGDIAYVADLELALRDFVDPLSPAQLLAFIQLQTARLVVNQRVSRYTDTDLQILTWLGRDAEALNHARLRPDIQERFDSILAVYNTLWEKNQPIPILLNEARDVAQAIEEKRERSKKLWKLARVLGQAKRFTEMRHIAQTIDSDEERVWVLIALAEALAQTGQAATAQDVFIEARAVAQAIQNTWGQAEAQRALAGALAQAGRFTEARAVAQAIQSTWGQAEAQRALAGALAQAGRFTEAHAVAQAIQDKQMRFWALGALVRVLAQAGRFTEARAVAQAIQDKQTQADALGRLGQALAQAGQAATAQDVFTEAHAVAQAIQDKQTQADALGRLGQALAQAGQAATAQDVFTEARAVAQAIQDKQTQADALGRLGQALAQAGQAATAQDVFTEAHAVAQAIQDKAADMDEVMQAKALGALGKALAQAGQVAAAQDVISKACGIGQSTEVIRALAEALAQAGQAAAVLDVFFDVEVLIKSSEEIWERPMVLIALAQRLAQMGQTIVAQDVFTEAQDAIENTIADWDKAAAFIALAEVLGQVGQSATAQGVFAEARDVIDNMEEGVDRDLMLGKLAGALAQARRFTEARDVIKNIDSEAERVDAQSALAQALAKARRFTAARDVIKDIKGNRDGVWLLSELSGALAQAQRFTEARAVMQEIKDEEARAYAQRALAEALAQAQHFTAARDVIKDIKRNGSRERAQSTLAEALAQAQHFTEARAVMQEIKDEEARAYAQRALAEALAQAQHFTAARDVIKDIKRNGSRERAQSTLAEALAQAQRFTEARAVMQEIKDEEARAKTLRKMTYAIAWTKHFAEAMTTLDLQAIDEFLQVLAAWISICKNTHPELSARVLQESVRIIGWGWPSWRKVHDILVYRQ